MPADTIADRIRRARERAGLTQAELAALLGVSGKNVVYHWEAGRRNPLDGRRETREPLLKWLEEQERKA